MVDTYRHPWYGQLPIIKREMHHRLGIPALHTTPPISSKPVENTLHIPDATLPLGPFLILRRRRRPTEPTEPTISVSLLIHSSRFVLDAFGEELEELLRILVFAGGEEGVVFPC